MFRFCARRALRSTLNASLKDADPELHGLIHRELVRQVKGIELIASENFTSRPVLEALGSVLTNKYAEGQPGARYYGGAQIIDEIEVLCQQRALAAFKLDPEQWGVNVQPYSGSPANFAVLSGILEPHDRIMGLDLPCGGHLTHGFYTATGKKISKTSVYFESLPYRTDGSGHIDFADLEMVASRFCPKLIIAGGSAYPRDWDYKRFREIADASKAFLMVDMAHYSGFVAAGEHSSPFDYADVVTSTTHKTLRGPRSGLIFYKRDKEITPGVNMGEQINAAVFPGLQGGPHEHQIAALATQLREVATPEFKEYIRAVRSNSQAMASELQRLGYTLVCDGTDNHIVMWNLAPKNITGSKMEKLFEMAEISVNKNTVPGDKSALNPSGIRLGSAAMTTRGLGEEDFKEVARLLHRGVEIGRSVQKPKMKVADFVAALKDHNDLKQLEHDVEALATKFPFPGLEDPFPQKSF